MLRLQTPCFQIRVVKILENHTLGLASKIEGFSRFSLENPSRGIAFRGLPSKIPQEKKLFEVSSSKFEGFKATLEKTSDV